MLYELKWVRYLDKGMKTIRLFDIRFKQQFTYYRQQRNYPTSQIINGNRRL